MTTRENNDDRIALLQGTLDLLILKSLVFEGRLSEVSSSKFRGQEDVKTIDF